MAAARSGMEMPMTYTCDAGDTSIIVYQASFLILSLDTCMQALAGFWMACHLSGALKLCAWPDLTEQATNMRIATAPRC